MLERVEVSAGSLFPNFVVWRDGCGLGEGGMS